MVILPDEILINIFEYICPSRLCAVDRRSRMLSKANCLWGPIVWVRFSVEKSTNFFEEFKWQCQLETHRRKYQRQWTLGCVGKFSPLPSKPVFEPAYTNWAAPEATCTT